MRGPASILLAASILSGCASVAASNQSIFLAEQVPSPEADSGFTHIGYATWDDSEPAYQLFPGDEIELQIPSAPELNKTLTVGPDGRVSLPLVGEMMVAARTVPEIRAEAQRRYATQLRRPQVEIASKAQGIKVFVGGEVGQPAVYDLIGDGDALRAIMQAGGFKPTSDLKKVVIIRRGQNGLAMMRTADLSKAFRHGDQPDFVPLARGDIVYVPRTGIANAGLIMQQYFRDMLPISFSYSIGGQQ